MLAVLLLTAVGAHGDAQVGVSSSFPSDSIFRRARRMVSEGQGQAGRALVDSLLRREEEGTAGYGNALYWRGALAATAAEAERDYRRVIVEYPLSLYVDDALLAIAELEQARGDRIGALMHLQRFVREHPVSSARGIAALAAARLAFEQRDNRTGCAMIAEAKTSASSTDVELRNQIDYYGTRCAVAETAPVPAPATTTKAPASDPLAATRVTPKAPDKDVATKPLSTAKAPAAPATKPPTRGIYTIQLAAYDTRVAAQQLLAKLAARGVKARISGATKPFRVRLDVYPTREAAQEAVASLKQRGIIGFVTTETRAPEEESP